MSANAVLRKAELRTTTRLSYFDQAIKITQNEPSPVGGRGTALAVDEVSSNAILTPHPSAFGCHLVSLQLGHRTALALLTQFTTVLPLRYPQEKAFCCLYVSTKIKPCVATFAMLAIE